MNGTAHEKQFELLWGARDIGKAIGLSERQTFHLLINGELPARQVGARWVIERSQLERFFTEGEGL